MVISLPSRGLVADNVCAVGEGADLLGPVAQPQVEGPIVDRAEQEEDSQERGPPGQRILKERLPERAHRCTIRAETIPSPKSWRCARVRGGCRIPCVSD